MIKSKLLQSKLPLEIMGVDKTEQRKRAAEALEMVELTEEGKNLILI